MDALLRALAAVSDPATDAADRQRCTLALESFKAVPDALRQGLELFHAASAASMASPAHQNLMRHFALHCASHALRNSTQSPEVIAEARRSALLIVQGMLRPAEERFVMQALVSLIEELAHVDLDWPELVPSLLLCVQPHHSGAQCAVHALCALSQDCVNASFNSRLLPSQRTALMRNLRSFVPDVFAKLLVITTQSSNSELVAASIECAAQWLSWVYLNEVPNLASVLDAWLALAVSRESSPRVRACALRSMADLASRKTADLDKSCPGGTVGLYEAIRSCCERVLQASPTSEERSACAVALNQVIEYHITALTDTLEKNLCSDVLLFLSQFEDTCLHVLPTWRLLVKNRKLLPAAVVPELIVRLSRLSLTTDEEAEVSPLLKDLALRLPSEVCNGMQQAFATLGPTSRVAKVIESIAQGLSPASLQRFASGEVTNDNLVQSIDAVIVGVLQLPVGAREVQVVQMLHAISRFLCAPPRGPSLYLGEALTRLVNAASSFSHPSDAHATVVTRKRAGNGVLTLCRRLYDRKENHAFMANSLLPALIKCVAGTALRPTERVLMLEAVVVAGKALPDQASRLNLMGSVLSDSVAVLQQRSRTVFDNLLSIDADPAVQEMRQWDKRGFVQDMASLPSPSRDVFLALMNVSTLCSEGIMSENMWEAVLPVARDALVAVRLNRVHGPEWTQTIHPVDARVLLSERLYSLVVEDINQRGAELGDARCAVVALLSALRSAACELFSSARGSACWHQFASAVFDVAQLAGEEDRDLLSLFSHVPVPAALLSNVCQTIMARLELPVVRRIGLPATIPVEAALEVDAHARRALASAFARSLVPLAAEHAEARRVLVLLLSHSAATKAAVDGLGALPLQLLNVHDTLPFAVFALKQEGNSEATHRALVVLICDMICRIAFGALSPEIIGRKVKPVASIEAVTLLQGITGAETKVLLEDMASAVSDKAMRDTVQHFFTGSRRTGGGGNAMSLEEKVKVRGKNDDDDNDELDWL